MCKASKGKTNEELLSVAQEIAFAKALAANDKSLRNRALKKLRKWLSQKSNQDCDGLRFTEEGFMRIWKGLFYCVWMSDKPLVQEDVVESISNLIHCFIHLEDAQKFTRCFFQSISQAWFSLDGHRMDKYLMLIRRFLRQIFEYMYKQDWDEGVVESLCGDLHKSFLMAPVGLNLHLAEIYIEELAKVGKGELKPETVLQILKPFAECMAVSNDTRLLKYVVDFIFLQLIRQSDEGIKYGAKFEVWKEMGFPGGDINVIQEASDEEIESDESMDEDEDVSETGAGALDPRAGNVDVLLPPVDFDPNSIRDYLSHLSRRKDTTTKARNNFGLIIKKYDKFIEGKYPLGIHKVEIPKVEDEEEIIEKTAQELLKEDRDFASERKMFKKGKRGQTSTVRWEVSPLEEANSADAEGVSNTGKWEVNKVTKRKNDYDDSICANMKKIKITLDDSLVGTSNSDECEKPVCSSNKNKDSSNVNDSCEGEVPPKQNRKKRKKQKPPQTDDDDKTELAAPLPAEIADMCKMLMRESEKQQQQKRKKIEEATIEWGLSEEWAGQKEKEIVIPFSPGKLTTKNVETPPASKCTNVSGKKKTPTSSSKKVEFVLNRNCAQGEHEYKESLKNSPSIPFDAGKKPLQGVLKTNPVGSPINPFYMDTN